MVKPFNPSEQRAGNERVVEIKAPLEELLDIITRLIGEPGSSTKVNYVEVSLIPYESDFSAEITVQSSDMQEIVDILTTIKQQLADSINRPGKRGIHANAKLLI